MKNLKTMWSFNHSFPFNLFSHTCQRLLFMWFSECWFMRKMCVCLRECVHSVFFCIPAVGLVNLFLFFLLLFCISISLSVCPYLDVYFFLFPLPTPAQQCLMVQHLKCSATINVHKHYVYNLRHLICQFCSVRYIQEIVYLCIKSVSEDNCNFVAHHVTTQLKINIVLPDCMKWGWGLHFLVWCVENLLELFIRHSFCISAASHLGSVCKLLCNLST